MVRSTGTTQSSETTTTGPQAPQTADGGHRAALRGAAGRTDSYDAGAAMLAPPSGAAPVQMHRREGQPVQMDGPGNQSETHSGSPGTFASLKSTVMSIAGGVQMGHFADVDLNVAIPVASVPGLDILVGVAGSIAIGNDGQKEFNCQLSGGARYGLGKIFNVNAAVTGALRLRGANLGDALIDALKQSIHAALEAGGVDSAFNSAHEALNDPQTRTERLIAWGVGEEWIGTFNNAYTNYFSFFRNNGAVGFEAGVAFQFGAEARNPTSGSGGAGHIQGRVGLEDVNNDDTQAFAELAGQLQGNNGNSSATVRFSKRARSGSASTVAIELNAQLSMPREAFSLDGQTRFKQALTAGLFIAKIASFGMAVNNAREGMSFPEGLALASTAANLGTAAFGTSGQTFDSLMGLDLKVTRTNGQWTVSRARFKSMRQLGTGTGRRVGGVRANVQVGSFVDFTGPVNDALAAMS